MSTSTNVEQNTPATDDYDPKIDPARKAKSNDVGWKYAYWPDLANKNVVKCILCDKSVSGGIKRLKEHLVGGYSDVVKCLKTTSSIAKEMETALRKNKRQRPTLDDSDEEDEEEAYNGSHEAETVDSCSRGSIPRSSSTPGSTSLSKKKKKNFTVLPPPSRNIIQSILKRSPEEVVDERRKKGPTQRTLENRYKVEEREKVVDYIADWFYESGIPFNAARSRSFEVMVEAIGQFGPGLNPPSYHELRMPLLQKAKQKTHCMRKRYEASWKTYGCTLMSDGWTDKRGRHLINFLVNCPAGTYFMGTVDASSKSQDAKLLFELLDDKIEEIGNDNVIQVVTDNGSNYVAAGKLLMQKRPSLFWTPCAAHCLDLMLEDIGNLKAYKKTITDARRITTFIYRHARLLDAMRNKTGHKDLVRHAVTRFATSFLTLQSLYKHREPLKQLFVSDDWTSSKLSKTEMGKKVVETLFSTVFWNRVEDCLRASQPLLVLLRIVDSDERPAMPEVYAAMEEAKQKIKENFSNKERLWKKVINIVQRRWQCQMEQKLYGASMFVNPSKYFTYIEKYPDACYVINEAFNDVLAKMVSDKDLQDKIIQQAICYKEARGAFSKEMAIRQRTTLSPIDWWTTHGNSSCLEISKIALRLLGLCCSSCGCERNWSTFEFIHTKKRNRLEHARLSDLVYVQYNRRLEARFKERREKLRNFDPLVYEDLDWSSEWMVNGGNEDLVHPGDDDGFSWRHVDEALGASSALDGRNFPRRTQGSNVYSRRGSHGMETGVHIVDSDSNNDEDIEEEDHNVVNDDEDIEDDYGVQMETTSSTPFQSNPGFLDNFD